MKLRIVIILQLQCNLHFRASSSSLMLTSASNFKPASSHLASKLGTPSMQHVQLESASLVSESIPFWQEVTLVPDDERSECDLGDEMLGICSAGSNSALRDLESDELNESKEVTEVRIEREEQSMEMQLIEHPKDCEIVFNESNELREPIEVRVEREEESTQWHGCRELISESMDVQLSEHPGEDTEVVSRKVLPVSCV